MKTTSYIQAEELPKALIYTPFPAIDEEKDYNTFIKRIFKGKTGTKQVNGLDLRYDANARMASWEGYQEHVEELREFQDTHFKRFTKILSSKELNYPLLKAICPIDYKYPEKEVEKIFSDYRETDVLFIHCHGNTDVIGTGGFVLTPAMLAQNLEVLDLSKKQPPIIVVWSCNSGKEKEGKKIKSDCSSYAENLRTELGSLLFNNLCVIGIDATIFIHPKGRRIHTMVTFGVEKKDTKKPESEVVKIYASPTPNEKLKEIKDTYDGLWTQIKKIIDIRRTGEPKKLLFSSGESVETNESGTNESKRSSEESSEEKIISRTSKLKISGTP